MCAASGKVERTPLVDLFIRRVDYTIEVLSQWTGEADMALSNLSDPDNSA